MTEAESLGEDQEVTSLRFVNQQQEPRTRIQPITGVTE